MALEEVTLDLSNDEPPAKIRALIDESDRRIDALFASGDNQQVPRYMPSDPELFFQVLNEMTERDLPLGRVFCEWGCGYAVCAHIAATLGYEAYGIELDPRMAERARSLAADLGIPVEIVETSYVPDGYDSYSGMGGEVLIREEPMPWRGAPIASDLRYDGMDRDIAEIDVFFAYPWPLEQDFMRELFDELAAEGAHLILFQQSSEILTFRKVVDDQE